MTSNHKSLYIVKETIKKRETHVTQKILAKHTSEKWLIFNTYKEFKQYNSKNQTTRFKKEQMTRMDFYQKTYKQPMDT